MEGSRSPTTASSLRGSKGDCDFTLTIHMAQQPSALSWISVPSSRLRIQPREVKVRSRSCSLPPFPKNREKIKHATHLGILISQIWSKVEEFYAGSLLPLLCSKNMSNIHLSFKDETSVPSFYPGIIPTVKWWVRQLTQLENCLPSITVSPFLEHLPQVWPHHLLHDLLIIADPPSPDNLPHLLTCSPAQLTWSGQFPAPNARFLFPLLLLLLFSY